MSFVEEAVPVVDQVRLEKNRRREARALGRGEIRFVLEGGQGMAHGSLLDVSNCGFRAAHHDPEMRAGLLVNFYHKLFRGQARILWSKMFEGNWESGFLVIRE
jgi:hypothetical protein